jgi:hypothetical protein
VTRPVRRLGRPRLTPRRSERRWSRTWRLANARFTVTGESDTSGFRTPPDAAPPLHASIERDAKPALNELVTMRG